MGATWAVAAALPLPVLVVVDPQKSGDIACLYLGLASAWLVVEFRQTCGAAVSPAAWLSRTLASTVAVACSVGLFMLFGIASGVQTGFPFPLMAALSAVPAIGLVPFFLKRVRHPFASIIIAAMLVLAAKLTACVIARLVYGPNYIVLGYVAADWHTAKLMISLFWTFSTGLSVVFLFLEHRACRRINEPPTGRAPSLGG